MLFGGLQGAKVVCRITTLAPNLSLGRRITGRGALGFHPLALSGRGRRRARRLVLGRSAAAPPLPLRLGAGVSAAPLLLEAVLARRVTAAAERAEQVRDGLLGGNPLDSGRF